MKYFFILGNHQILSLAEIKAVFPKASLSFVDEVCFLETSETTGASSSFDEKALIRNLGGTIKIGRVLSQIKNMEEGRKLALKELLLVPKEGKFNFGISVYGSAKVKALALGLELKKDLKANYKSLRLVTSRDKALSSVVVEQNKLVSSGKEIVFFGFKDKLFLGITEAVQPFKELSFRDYGRPARDDLSGMLPPKLAQIMINLSQAKKNETILDPFCGSGTILTEAILMGYKKIMGSDISAKAIKDSRENIEWIAEKFNLDTEVSLSEADVKQLSKKFKPNSISSIITETYLGPQRGKVDIFKTSQELTGLYNKALKEIKEVLSPGGSVVMVLPVFLQNGQKRILPLTIPMGLKIKESDIRDYRDHKDYREGITPRGSFIYGRSGQKIWREIIILKK